MKIGQLIISSVDDYDIDGVDELLQDYLINRENIISIAPHNGMVYLYYETE